MKIIQKYIGSELTLFHLFPKVLTKRQYAILELIKKNKNGISGNNIIKIMYEPKSSIFYDLKILRLNNLITIEKQKTSKKGRPLLKFISI